MTNGEKFKEIFKISQIDEGELYAYVWLPNHDAAEFSIDWWNAEYKEPTTKNDLGVDCISREATVKRLCNLAEYLNEHKENSGAPYIMAALFIQDNKTEFPSVTPIRPKGHWITRPHIYGVAFCSECGFELKINNTNYCPNCGADMRGNTKRKGKSINGNNESYNCENWIP